MTEALPDQIAGRCVDLDDHRSVFVGERVGDAERHVFLQFKNGTAVERFRISQEAAVALRALLWPQSHLGAPKTDTVEPGPSVRTWQLVSSLELDA